MVVSCRAYRLFNQVRSRWRHPTSREGGQKDRLPRPPLTTANSIHRRMLMTTVHIVELCSFCGAPPRSARDPPRALHRRARRPRQRERRVRAHVGDGGRVQQPRRPRRHLGGWQLVGHVRRARRGGVSTTRTATKKRAVRVPSWPVPHSTVTRVRATPRRRRRGRGPSRDEALARHTSWRLRQSHVQLRGECCELCNSARAPRLLVACSNCRRGTRWYIRRQGGNEAKQRWGGGDKRVAMAYFQCAKTPARPCAAIELPTRGGLSAERTAVRNASAETVRKQ